jgi:hypothetical protein
MRDPIALLERLVNVLEQREIRHERFVEIAKMLPTLREARNGVAQEKFWSTRKRKRASND